MIPFLAPVGAIWGLLWRRRHERDFEALPPLDRALSRIGLIVGSTISGLIVVIALLYGVFGHR